MKKFLALFIAATLLLGTLLITPAFAEDEPASYAKDTVLQATVLMPETDAFTAIEGKLTYDSTALEYCSGTFEAPHVAGMVFSDQTAGKFTFNTSKIENSFDISEDHVVIKAQFKVLADNTVPDFTSSIEDVYILNGIQFIDVSKTSVVQVSVVSTPSTESTDSTEDTQASESQSVPATESQETQASESQSVPATESQDTQASEPASTRTVYYIDTLGWDAVYAYAYSDTYLETELPGTQMTYFGVDDDNNPIYSVEVPVNAAFIIFNDGKGTQTPAGALTDDATTFYMNGGVLDHYSHITPSESQDTQATESTTADEGYPVTFVTDGHATINVYHTRNYATSAVDENVTTAVSRNRDTGEPDSIDGDAQINFLVVLENGYEIDSVTALPATNYKNLKGSDETLVENMYRITKVAGELTITVTTKLSETQDTSATESSETTATESSETTATESSETTATESSETTATSSSETTATESSDTQATTPTQAPATTIKFPSAKKTIYVNASTTVKATVTNGVGTTTYTSSNTKVATINKTTGKVVGKKAGTVTITAKNNGKVATMKISVVKRNNPITVKTKTIKANSKKTKSFTKAKAFTVKKAKGTVTFKKAKGDKKITISGKGKVTVKKGLKKGTYKVKVKVTAKGNTAYKAKTLTVTLKVTVK